MIGVFEIDKNIGNISRDELEMDLIDSGLEELHYFQDSILLQLILKTLVQCKNLKI